MSRSRRESARVSAMGRIVPLAVVLWGAAGGVSCADAGPSAALAHTRPSAESLVAGVLEAVAAGDAEELRGFLVTREEYETALWPQMPDGDYTPFDFVWGLNEVNSRKGLRQLLNEFGGDRLELVTVRFSEEPESYEDFRLHTRAEVVVRRPDTGDTGTLSSFDVFVEHASGWKLLNYDEL